MVKTRGPSWIEILYALMRFWNLKSYLGNKALYITVYFRILSLKIFQLSYRLLRISNRDIKDLESCVLFHFMTDPLSEDKDTTFCHVCVFSSGTEKMQISRSNPS